MRGSSCLFNSHRALYRVFVAPGELREATLVPRQLLSTLHVRSASTPCYRHPSIQWTRLLNTASKRQRAARNPEAEPEEDGDEKQPSYDRRYTTAAAIKKANRDRLPQDHEITDPKVMVIDNGPPEGPHSTRFVLSKLEPNESLRMIEPYKPADPKLGTPATYAVCKIFDKKEAYSKMREMKERKKEDKEAGRVKPKTKMVELTWSIGDNDLQTKLRQMERFVAGGMPVEVTIGKKKHSKVKPSMEDAQQVLSKIKDHMRQLNIPESKPQQGSIEGTVKLYFGSK